MLQSAEEDEKLNLIETMVEYKEALILQLQQIEHHFDVAYKNKRNLVNDKQYIIKFKEYVALILEKSR